MSRKFSTHRRAVLRGGALGLGLSAAPVRAALPADGAVDVWLIDSRLGVIPPAGPTLAFDGDITPLWFTRIDPRWRQRGFVLGGITRANTLFVLEQLARTRGRSVVARRNLAAGAVQWIIAPTHPSAKG